MASTGQLCKVVVPPAIYTNVTTTLNGQFACEVDFQKSQVTYTGTGTAISVAGVQQFILRNLLLFGQQTPNTIGLQVGTTSGGNQTTTNHFYDIQIGSIFGVTNKGFDNGIVMQGAGGNNGTYFNEFHNVSSNANLTRGLVCNLAAANFANQNEFFGGTFQQNGFDGIQLNGCQGNGFHDVDFENNNVTAPASVNIST